MKYLIKIRRNWYENSWGNDNRHGKKRKRWNNINN